MEKKNGDILTRIFSEILKVSGLDVNAVEDAEKN